MKTTLKLSAALLLLLAIHGLTSSAQAQGTAFTYQGSLHDGANAANGNYDLRFGIYDQSSGGNQQGSLITNSATAVTNGLFTVTLDFGNQFPGTNRWLDLAVRTNGSGGVFFPLTPRQKLTPTPYAITAANVSGVLPATGLSGTYGSAVVFNNTGDIFAGSGFGLTGLNANSLTIGTVPAAALGNAWKTTGNGGTSPGPNFVGTTDNQPLELHVNGARAFLLQPVAGGAPTLIGGSSSNAVDPTVHGAVIGGGDGNTIAELSDFSIISGGTSNQIQYASFNSTIAGGYSNFMGPNIQYSTIASGEANQMDNVVFCSSIAGGYQNDLQTFVQLSSILGGYLNQIQYIASYSSIVGGERNVIGTNTSYSVVGGGQNNTVNGNDSIIGAGELNTISTNALYSSIASGFLNQIQNGAQYSAVGGGNDNVIGTNCTYSVISGGNVNTIQSNANTSAIGGGLFNQIQSGGQCDVIAGGDANVVQTNATFAAMGGGSNNTIETNTQCASLLGGQLNTVFPGGHFSTIGGGKANNIGALSQYSTIAGGGQNSTVGNFATVPGGAYNIATGDYSLAAGTGAHAVGNRSFVWNSFPNPNYVTGTNEFYVFAENGFSVDYNVQRSDGGGTHWVYIGNATGGTFGTVPATISTWTTAYLSDGGAWTSASDRARKENFVAVDVRALLEKVAALPIQTWNYTNEAPAIRHLGPVSQDFHAAFDLNGSDDKHITDVDEAGVALAAIQGLNQKLTEELKRRDAENAALQARLEKLEQLVNQTASIAK